jgi:hypothetical protein
VVVFALKHTCSSVTPTNTSGSFDVEGIEVEVS